MAKFRLLPGGPCKIDGKFYQPGDVVENDADLSKLFVNRFELLSGEPGVRTDEDPKPLRALTPYDVSSTRKAQPATLQPNPEQEPSEEDQQPVGRPASAPVGGTSLEGGGETEEEVTDEEPAEDEEKPTRTSRTSRTSHSRSRRH